MRSRDPYDYQYELERLRLARSRVDLNQKKTVKSSYVSTILP